MIEQFGGNWKFGLDEDDYVVVTSESVPDNLRLAVETLILPLGSAWLVESYLREWRRLEVEFGVEYSVGTDTARVTRLDANLARIEDMYGQFETTTIEVVSLIEMFEGLARFLKLQEAGHA